MKTMILHSGGIDSTILASTLIERGENPTSVYFDFGQNASENELKAVRATSGLLDMASDVIDLHPIRNSFASSPSSVMVALPNPGKHVLELGSLLLLGPALTYAHNNSFEKIYIGYTKLDADYSDEYSKKLLDAMSQLALIAGFQKIEIEAPMITENKESILQLGSVKKEIIERSWSCIYEYEKHCGTCQACQSRKEAFAKAGMRDPTKYLK